jgi:hypothetical protein
MREIKARMKSVKIGGKKVVVPPKTSRIEHKNFSNKIE